MFALDLFNTKYEKELNEGAVDNTVARLIEPLSQRAADVRTQLRNGNISPAEMKALEHEYEELVAKRLDIIHGRKAQDECMGYGSLVGEAGIGQDLVTPQQRVKQAQPQKQTPAGKVVDTAKQAAKWLAGKGGPGKEGPTYESEVNEQEDDAEAEQELGAGYGIYKELLKAWNEKKPYVIIPLPGGQNLSITRNQVFNVLYALKNMNDNTFKKTITNAFSSLDKFMVWSNSIKRYQLPKEKPQPPQGAPGQMALFKEAGQKKNSEKEVAPQSQEVQRYLTKVRRMAPNATSDLEAIAKDELEKQARVNKNIDDLEQVNARQDAALKKAMTLDRQQGNEIDDVESQIAQLSQRLQSIKAAKPVSGQTTSIEPQTKVATATTVEPTSTAPEVKSDEPKNQPATIRIPQPIYIVEPEKLPQKDQEIYAQVKNLEKELNDKIQGIGAWEKAAKTDDKSRDELKMLRKDMERTNHEINQKIEQLEKSGAKVQRANPPRRQNPASSIRQNLNKTLGNYDPSEVEPAPDEDVVGNMISPEDLAQLGNMQRPLAQGKKPATVEESAMSELDAVRQDLEGMNERQFYAAHGMSKAAFQQKYRTLLKPAQQQDVPSTLDEGQQLHVGDPIIVTAPNEFEGKTGEIYNFSPSGTFVIVDLYNHGKHSMHLSDVEYNQYADKQDEDDWYDDELDEGFQDFNKVEPYAVCLAGKPVKKFDYYEEARRFHDNWKQKLYREGNKEKADKITLMPIMDEAKADPTGSWVVYNSNKVKRFKTHGGAKAYAEKAGGKVASSEFYADKVQKQGVAENDDWDDGEWEDIPTAHAEVNPAQAARYPEQVLRAIERNPAMRADIIADYERKQGVKEAQTDYQKRRQRERDVDAGRPVKALPKNPQTDYAKKRAKDRKDMELGEDSSTSSEAVEIAVIRRILVAHTDLIMEFGLDKVTQAIEEVAYNVGDVDEIGSSDVSAWVNEVKQILGVTNEEQVNEKWSEKYKRSIDCSHPKGFSQKAHCAGRKK